MRTRRGRGCAGVRRKKKKEKRVAADRKSVPFHLFAAAAGLQANVPYTVAGRDCP